MKRELRVAHTSGIGNVVTLAVEGAMTAEMHMELTLFLPALVAASQQTAIRAWYDDVEHSVTIQRDLSAPPRPRRR